MAATRRWAAIATVRVATGAGVRTAFAFAEQLLRRSVDSRHLACGGTCSFRIIGVAVGVVRSSEAAERRAHLGVTCVGTQPEELVRRWASRRCCRHTHEV